jgi:hypothetical protein
MMASPKALLEHIEQKHKNDLVTFKCDICGKCNPNLKGIAIHLGICNKGKTKKNESDKVYPC